MFKKRIVTRAVYWKKTDIRAFMITWILTLRYINPVVLCSHLLPVKIVLLDTTTVCSLRTLLYERKTSTAKNFIIRSDDVGVNASFEYTRNYDSWIMASTSP